MKILHLVLALSLGTVTLTGCASLMESRLKHANSAAQEAALFRSIGSSRELHAIDFLDAHGNSLGTDRGVGFSRVNTIEIEWNSGRRFRHRVIDTANLPLLIRE